MDYKEEKTKFIRTCVRCATIVFALMIFFMGFFVHKVFSSAPTVTANLENTYGHNISTQEVNE